MSEQTDALWALLPHPDAESVVRVAYRRGDGKMIGDYARNARELHRFAQVCLDRRVNAYVAPNPTEYAAGTRHSARDVSHWSWVFIDVDPLTDAIEPNPREVLDEAFLTLGEWIGKDLRARPTIIDSGRGMQGWIRLPDVNLFDEFPLFGGDWVWERHSAIPGVCTGDGVTRKMASKTMSYWLGKLAERIGTKHGCRIDTSCSDLPRLMRLPGTINAKTGRPTQIIQEGTGPSHGFATLMITGVPKEVFIEPEVNVNPGMKWQMYFSDLTRESQQYLLLGREEPGRHKVVWHTAKKFAELGCSREEARKAILQANVMMGKEQELKPAEISHALDTAFGK